MNPKEDNAKQDGPMPGAALPDDSVDPREFDWLTGRVQATESALFAALPDDADFGDGGLPARRTGEPPAARPVLQDDWYIPPSEEDTPSAFAE